MKTAKLRKKKPLVVWDDSKGLTLREAFDSANEDSDPASCFPIGDSIETAEAMMFVVKGALEVQVVRRLLAAVGFVTEGKDIVDAVPDVQVSGFTVTEAEAQPLGGA